MDYYEEPDAPLRPSPVWPSRDSDAPVTNSLNDLNELRTRFEFAEDYKNAWCTPEAKEYFAKLPLELEREEKKTSTCVSAVVVAPIKLESTPAAPECRSKKSPLPRTARISSPLPYVVATGATR